MWEGENSSMYDNSGLVLWVDSAVSKWGGHTESMESIGWGQRRVR